MRLNKLIEAVQFLQIVDEPVSLHLHVEGRTSLHIALQLHKGIAGLTRSDEGFLLFVFESIIILSNCSRLSSKVGVGALGLDCSFDFVEEETFVFSGSWVG